MPNGIRAVALAPMRLQFVSNNRFGLLKTVFSLIGGNTPVKLQWTAPDHPFTSMLISYCLDMVILKGG